MKMDSEKALKPHVMGHMSPGGGAYAILDAARRSEVAIKPYEFQSQWVSLYKGEPEEALYDVAPYLLHLGDEQGENKELCQWIEEELWGDSCGIFIYSDSDLDTLFRHFQEFIIVSDEAGTPLYFRFYDPRVLRIYLPTCTSDELITFFGPVTAFVMEGEMPEQKICFSLSQGELEIKEYKLSDTIID